VFKTIKITGKTGLCIQGPLPDIPTKITKVVLIRNSSCVLELLSFVGIKGVDGNNNNSCRGVPAMDGKDGLNAIIIDSSMVTVSGCKVKGGDGGNSGLSYQGAMLCVCGSKGIPGSAIRAIHSTLSLINDSLISGYCAGTSIAGCFTNNCTGIGYGQMGLTGSVITVESSRIDTLSLDATSTIGYGVKTIQGRIASSSAPVHSGRIVSISGKVVVPDNFKTPYAVRVYNAKGRLVWARNGVETRRIDLGRVLPQDVYVIALQSGESRITGKFLSIRNKQVRFDYP